MKIDKMGQGEKRERYYYAPCHYRSLKSQNNMNVMKYLFTAIALLIATVVEAKDITQLVKSSTDFDDRIAAACAGKCGNRGGSQLDSINITEKDKNRYDVISKASAKFHQHTVIPGMFGGRGFDIEYLINVTAYGAMDSATCLLTINKIDVSGDNLGIANSAKSYEGKTYYLNNCKKYI